jgi:hypothetical protein
MIKEPADQELVMKVNLQGHYLFAVFLDDLLAAWAETTRDAMLVVD